MRKKGVTGLFCALLAAALAAGGCAQREPILDDRLPERESASRPEPEEMPGDRVEQEAPDFSVDAITEGIGLHVTAELGIALPEEGEAEVCAENYYVTGTSDPGLPLLLNGEPVGERGVLGSFGIFAGLEVGENTFVFTQGDRSETVVITRSATELSARTGSVTRAMPGFDIAIRAGEGYRLSCVAPAGSSVTAEVDGRSILLEQRAATSEQGIPAAFAADYDPGDVTGTVDLGPVTYTFTHEGETASAVSEGRLFAAGREDELLVRVKEASACVFTGEDPESEYFATLKRGAVDRVEEIGYNSPGDQMYRLAMGGWVIKDAAEPLTEPVPWENTVFGFGFSREGARETLTLRGCATPPYRAEWSGGELALTLFHTECEAGPGNIESGIFSGCTVEADGGDSVLRLPLREPGALWGYLVEYEGSDTVISFTSGPEPAGGDRPLAGVTIFLDPGHGGSDIGAFGVAREMGAAESEINLAAARAAERYLRGLGATVILSRDRDVKVEIPDIMDRVRVEKPDLMISLHSNSFSYSLDGTGPSGVEAHYYEQASRRFAELLSDGIAERTGRKNRGAKNSYFKVTLNSYAPTVMVEMGFLSNPLEYDEMRTGEGIFNTAAAIGDAVVELLCGGADPGGEE